MGLAAVDRSGVNFGVQALACGIPECPLIIREFRRAA
jgi:hypothetical protein